MQQVDISPPTNVYATFGRLNYTPWHAIAEFVDNATQSYFAGSRLPGRPALPDLSVEITYSLREALVVHDNALGMDAEQLGKALQLSTPPADTSGRSEFGMGLKTAACWFGSRWTVSTVKYGEPWRYTVVFDVDEIASGNSHHVEITTEPADPAEHGTTLTIEKLSRPIAGRQIEKTKRLLASIYRRDLARGGVTITWNGDQLEHDEPELMLWDVDGESVPCRIEIDTVVVDPHTDVEHRVTGWVGALRKMSAQDAGLALLRRERMIIGGPGSNWRPPEVVGSLNSHSGKRLVGELEMNDFPVNFTKDGFAWDGGLEEQLMATIGHLAFQVRNFALNARTAKAEIQPEDFVRAVHEVQQGLDNPAYVEAVSGARTASFHEVAPETVGDTTRGAVREVPELLTIPMGTGKMTARLELVDGGPGESWLAIGADPHESDTYVVKLNTGNRFVAQHIDQEVERTLIAKFALAVATAEAQAVLVFGDEIPPEEFREFLNLTLDHSVTG